MAEIHASREEATAVDDVRQVRERIAREHGGDLRKHVEETNRVAAEVRAKLGVMVVPPPEPDAQRTGG